MCVLPVNAVERMRRPLPTYKSYASLVSSVQSFEAHPMTPILHHAHSFQIASKPGLTSCANGSITILDALLGRI